MLFTLRKEQYFQSRGYSTDLNFSIKAALVAADAVHNARNVVKLVLNLAQELLLGDVRLPALEEVLLLEGVLAIALSQVLQ